jgi:hypothetical protein
MSPALRPLVESQYGESFNDLARQVVIDERQWFDAAKPKRGQYLLPQAAGAEENYPGRAFSLGIESCFFAKAASPRIFRKHLFQAFKRMHKITHQALSLPNRLEPRPYE